MITASMSFLITRNLIDHTIYTRELARSGALITHDKDQTVLTLMQLDDIIETNFRPVREDMSLGEMLHESVAKSKRNIFPVLDAEERLKGVVLLDDIREFMFDVNVYDKIKVASLMQNPPEQIFYGTDSMQQVMQKFQNSGAWNLPVIKDEKYIGFISKSKLLTAYRRKLINFTH